MNNITFRTVDLKQKDDADIIINMLSSFSKTVKQITLSEEIKNTLINNLIKFNNTIVFIVEFNNKPVGLAICFKSFSTFRNNIVLNIHDLFIINEFQNQGIGGKFLEFISAETEKLGYCRVSLEVQEENKRAMGLYEKHGFTGTKEDVMYAMTKEL